MRNGNRHPRNTEATIVYELRISENILKDGEVVEALKYPRNDLSYSTSTQITWNYPHYHLS